MRTFTEIPDEFVLVAIPQTQLDHLEAALERTMAANGQMIVAYEAMKSSV